MTTQPVEDKMRLELTLQRIRNQCISDGMSEGIVSDVCAQVRASILRGDTPYLDTGFTEEELTWAIQQVQAQIKPPEWLVSNPASSNPMDEPLIRLPKWTKGQWLVLGGTLYVTTVIVFAILAIFGPATVSWANIDLVVFLVLISAPITVVILWLYGTIVHELWHEAGKKR